MMTQNILVNLFLREKIDPNLPEKSLARCNSATGSFLYNQLMTDETHGFQAIDQSMY